MTKPPDENSSAEAAPVSMMLPIPVDADPRRVKSRFWDKFWRTVGRVPFSEDIAASYYCAMDPLSNPPSSMPSSTVLATAMGVVGAHIGETHRRAARRLLQTPPPRRYRDAER